MLNLRRKINHIQDVSDVPNEKATGQDFEKAGVEISRNLYVVMWSLKNKSDENEIDHLWVRDNLKDDNLERVENQMKVKAKSRMNAIMVIGRQLIRLADLSSWFVQLVRLAGCFSLFFWLVRQSALLIQTAWTFKYIVLFKWKGIFEHEVHS